MAKKKEVTVEDKLRALYDLQLIDSRIDEIKSVRGELPLEIEDLGDEITGLNTRVSNLEEDISNLETDIKNKKNTITEAGDLVVKYTKQQDKVRNNREFDSLSKEIEFQGLEIELSEKRINEYRVNIEQKKEVIAQNNEVLERKNDHFKHKKDELDAILTETQKEEELLHKKSEEFSEVIEAHLLKAYKRIRENANNGLAVVPVERGASGGSFFTIPPQRQVEIANRKKIITDEHSGRILVDSTLAEEEKEKIGKLFS
ncbi:MAG: hypothetical protein KAH07_00635 [Flavobacteriaceae bacterium]|nr:hypothetical protein [Flavobacteriaceae bacterium]